MIEDQVIAYAILATSTAAAVGVLWFIMELSRRTNNLRNGRREEQNEKT